MKLVLIGNPEEIPPELMDQFPDLLVLAPGDVGDDVLAKLDAVSGGMLMADPGEGGAGELADWAREEEGEHGMGGRGETDEEDPEKRGGEGEEEDPEKQGGEGDGEDDEDPAKQGGEGEEEEPDAPKAPPGDGKRGKGAYGRGAGGRGTTAAPQNPLLTWARRTAGGAR